MLLLHFDFKRLETKAWPLSRSRTQGKLERPSTGLRQRCQPHVTKAELKEALQHWPGAPQLGRQLWWCLSLLCGLCRRRLTPRWTSLGLYCRCQSLVLVWEADQTSALSPACMLHSHRPVLCGARCQRRRPVASSSSGRTICRQLQWRLCGTATQWALLCASVHQRRKRTTMALRGMLHMLECGASSSESNPWRSL